MLFANSKHKFQLQLKENTAMNFIALYNDISQHTSVTFKMFYSVYYGSVEKTCIYKMYIFFQLTKIELSRRGDLTMVFVNSHCGEVSRLILGPKGNVQKSNSPNGFYTHSFNM